jgi:uncharacterized protein YdaU (DUF1376 family)
VTKAPAFQFYAAEYLADMNVQLLTLEQEGAYIRLLSFCWREGRVPNNDIRLASLCKGCKVSILGAVKMLFEVSVDGHYLFHKRLEKEREKHTAFRERQIVNGSKGGRAKAGLTQNLAKPNPGLSQDEDKTQENEKAWPSSAFAFASSSAKREITPEMVTRAVLTELGLSGRDLAVVLDEVCRSQMKLYETPGALRDALVAGWREYDAAKPLLTYTKGAAKFFGEGDWKNKAGWPWKDGKQPAAGRVYVNS